MIDMLTESNAMHRCAVGLAFLAGVMWSLGGLLIKQVANVILLQYTAPVYAALLGAWLLHEPVARLDWLTIAVEPILNPVWVFLVMGEAPGQWAFVGALE